YTTEFAKLCPRLTGKTELEIEAADDDQRKLLKARLNQGRQEIAKWRICLMAIPNNSNYFSSTRHCLVRMGECIHELYLDHPRSRIAWLEELLILGQEVEQVAITGVKNGNYPPVMAHTAGRHRLKLETMLWTAMNPPKK